MIIDAHSHLGDVLNYNGGTLIHRTGIRVPDIFNPQALNEQFQMRNFGFGLCIYRLLKNQTIKAEAARNAAATLENMQASLDEAGIDYTVCLPIEPYLTFDDLRSAVKQDARILPFTSINFDRMDSVEKKLRADVKNGAYGLKLHPVIQRVSPSDSRVMQALEAFQPLGKPVLIHAGKYEYYPVKENKRNIPEYGSIKPIAGLIRSFPGIKFIVGHSGLFWHREVCELLAGWANVWVDTSFQSPHTIRTLIETFGPERVMYASDWPYGMRPPHVSTVRIACRGVRTLENRLFFKNAAELLGLDVKRAEIENR
ncbi:MAG: amidohydrolase [Spirochaetes bacterium]|nr:amidohydrolase [Spirochaetota bacterium]